MPGPVASAHAEIEEECGACHAPFSKASQNSLCLDCHERIADDLSAGRGFHGAGNRLAEREYRSCHGEHEGRDADMVGLVPEAFDHGSTGFELSGRHAEAACRDCHQPDQAFREAPSTCAGCHGSDDPHLGNLGSDCAACHGSSGWREHTFDHLAATGFALIGGHLGAQCTSCHAGQSYESTPTQCAACHALDDVHLGGRGSDCAGCHSERTWTDARFDHRAETGFLLEGTHARTACSGCHLESMALAEPPTECVGCHSADDVHVGQRGPDCGACHGQETWEGSFDHGRRTGFALAGAHRELACDACHRGALEAALPSGCEGCHRADDPHGGTLTACGDCHGPDGWMDSVRFDHDFTGFPLLGVHRLAACEQCHVTLTFHDTGQGCIDCHRGEDVHDRSLGPDCGSCHAPSDWRRWQFDHDRQTEFALTGAHADLACEGCHPRGRTDALAVSSTCASCHQSDDVHHGQFGDHCERCHDTTTFADPRRMF